MSDQQPSSASSSSANDNKASGAANKTAELKNQISNKLQSNKLLVLKLHSILTWEQDAYPLVVVGVVTLAFIAIHCLNSSVLATLSYLGIAAALFDLALPTITKNLASKQAKLADKDSQLFDKICADLAKHIVTVKSLPDWVCSLKSKKPSLYYPVVLVALFISAYLGNKINNLFLTYLATLVVALLPGLEKKGYTDKACALICAKLGRPVPAGPGAGDRRSSGKKN